MNYAPREELEWRIGRFQEQIKKQDLDGAIVIENVALYYFAGSMQQGLLYVPPEGSPLYMVRRSYQRAVEESAWDSIVPLRSFKQLPSILEEYGAGEMRKIGLELDVLPVNNYRRLQRALPDIEFIDASALLREVRMIKSSYELKFFRSAAEMADRVFKEAPSFIEEGKPEVELAAELECLYRKLGHQGVGRMRAFNMEMFFGHVFSGENGARVSFLDSPTGGQGVTPASPQSAGWKPIQRGEPVVLDYGGTYEGYTVDQTRIFSLGKLPSRLEKAYRASKRVQDEVVKKAVPGVTCGELYSLAQEVAADEGLGDYFMGFGEDQVKYIGHGVGLDFDEFPHLAKGSTHVLQPGVVFALEPKFLFPGEGMVGLENTWVIGEKGAEKISLTPDDLVIL